MDNITQEQINARIEFIENTEEPASVDNVTVAAILAFLNLKVQQMVTADDLNNEATARQNADTLLQGLIDALNQTAVHYSDVGELVPELSGLRMLALNQSPLVVFKSMGAAYDGVSREVTIGDGEAKYGGTGSSFQYNRRGNIGTYPVVTYKVYFNSYTGRLYKWTGSSFELVGGGGIDSGIYEVIKSNVNLVTSKLDSLISAMAMLAFSGTVNKNALKVGSLSWVEPEIHTPRIITPIDGSTLEFGNATDDDVDIRIGLFVEGADLTKGLTLSITEGSSRFRLESGSSSISKDDANNGTTIYLIYNSSSSVANATGKLNIHSNNEIDVNVNLHGTYSEQGGGDPVDPESYQVSAGTLSHVQITETLPATVSSGGSFTGHLVADSGYSLPTSIVVSGTHGTVSYDQSTGVFTIPNITSNVAISATAVAPVSIELVKGKYIAYQGTSPKTPSNASLYTDICCMTAVLSVDFSDIDETVWETAYIEWVHGGIASKGNISFTKNNGTTAESVQGASSEKDTYSVDNMTSQTLSYWKQRRTLVNGLIATFKYDTSTNKVASGCCVVLKDANGNILKTLISANDLQGATFVNE